MLQHRVVKSMAVEVALRLCSQQHQNYPGKSQFCLIPALSKTFSFLSMWFIERL